MLEVLEKVKQFASAAHEGQVRKYAPEAFVQHPIRVMNTCMAYTSEVTVLAAALLHDVLEDTDITSEEMFTFLREIMPLPAAQRTVTLVEQLTDVYIKADYPQWNRRKRKREEIKRLSKISADAQTIKYADIIDNCVEIIRHDREFADRFLRECHDLLQKITKGNTTLYKKALDVVESGLRELKELPASERGRMQ